MKRYDLIVVGAGPSGLSAAIEAAKRGLKVVVFDENEKPGGQLFKQIHKFFGSKEHKAKVRGFVIGEELLAEADKAGVEVELNATVVGMYQDTAGGDWSRSSPDDDELTWSQTRKQNPDAGKWKCGTGSQFSVKAVWM